MTQVGKWHSAVALGERKRGEKWWPVCPVKRGFAADTHCQSSRGIASCVFSLRRITSSFGRMLLNQKKKLFWIMLCIKMEIFSIVKLLKLTAIFTYIKTKKEKEAFSSIDLLDQFWWPIWATTGNPAKWLILDWKVSRILDKNDSI